MQKLELLLLLLAFVGSAVFATESATGSTPKAESIRELLAVTEARRLANDVIRQMEGQMRARVRQSLHGKQLGARQQKALDDSVDQVAALFARVLISGFTGSPSTTMKSTAWRRLNGHRPGRWWCARCRW